MTGAVANAASGAVAPDAATPAPSVAASTEASGTTGAFDQVFAAMLASIAGPSATPAATTGASGTAKPIAGTAQPTAGVANPVAGTTTTAAGSTAKGNAAPVKGCPAPTKGTTITVPGTVATTVGNAVTAAATTALAETGGEPATDTNVAVQQTIAEGEAEPEQKVGTTDSQAKDSKGDTDLDTTTLSSILAMWQILPPTPPTVPTVAAPTGISNTGNNGATAGIADAQTSAAQTNPTTVADPLAALAQTAVPASPLATPPVENQTATPVPAASIQASATPAAITPLPAFAEKAMPKFSVAHLQKVAKSVVEPAAKIAPKIAATVVASSVTVDGTTAAKELRAMPDTVLHPSAKNPTAPFAEAPSAPKTNPETSRDAVRAVAASGNTAEQQEEQGSGDANLTSSEHAATELSALTTNHSTTTTHDFEVADPEIKTHASDTAQVIEHIQKTLDQMRTQSGQRVELRLPLHDGNEVVVKLSMEQGEVKATFQTDSQDLRQALEQGWSQYSQNSSDRTVKLGPAVFESGSTQNGAGSFQQTPDQRQQSANARLFETDPADAAALRAAARKVAANPMATATASQPAPSNLQIYA